MGKKLFGFFFNFNFLVKFDFSMKKTRNTKKYQHWSFLHMFSDSGVGLDAHMSVRYDHF